MIQSTLYYFIHHSIDLTLLDSYYYELKTTETEIGFDVNGIEFRFQVGII